MSKNILITGGGGMIGKNLIKHLLNDSTVEKIMVFDNFITSNDSDFQKFKNKYDTESKVLLFAYDITDVKSMTFVKLNFPFDEIYHLASLASPIFYKKFPLETLDVGYIGTKNILEIARYQNSKGVKFTQNRNVKILFSSTSEVYGDAQVSPQHENYYGNVNCFGERSSYDESKRVAEALCYTYLKSYGVNVKIARIFNTYGPHMLLNDGRIITEVIRHLKNESTLTIYGDGEQTRSICYVKDTVDMLVKLMASDCNEPVNIGNNQERTINETVNMIEKVWNEMFNDGTQLNRVYKPLTQNDPLQRKPCLEFNKQVLGEIEYTSFEEGIKETIKYFV
jgi:nucleoside-diphosphate-sugar epimerase